MQETISAILLIIGTLFICIASLGILRFPDLFMRVSASTKASTLGVGFLFLALAVHFNDLGITMRSLATTAFLVISAPVAAHLISRSAYSSGSIFRRISVNSFIPNGFFRNLNRCLAIFPSCDTCSSIDE